MRQPSAHPLLEEILRSIPRPYRLPDLPEPAPSSWLRHFQLEAGGDVSSSESSLPSRPWPLDCRPSTAIAIIIEYARRALAAGERPGPDLKQGFVHAMAALICEAAREDSGDPAFRAMVLKHGSPIVREHAALSAQFQDDKRRVLSLVNALAHPAKLQRQPAGLRRDALTQLHAAATASAWSDIATPLERLLAMPECRADAVLTDRLTQLKGEVALRRLQRLESLQTHEEVQQYLSLWEQQGPAANSHAAAREGAAGRRRGMNVETLAKHGLDALAERLNTAHAQAHPYRVVTALHVPASFPARQEGAKTEWDAVLLQQAPGQTASKGAPVWNLCLMVEAKASADAAGTDLARLLRGLRLLAQAHAATVYAFRAREGVIHLNGASLTALPGEMGSLENTVLYCSDDSSDREPRLLSAAARMQLLSAPQSLEVANALQQAKPVDTKVLGFLWEDVLNSEPWQAVLHQYLTLRQARELMVHTSDLLQAASG